MRRLTLALALVALLCAALPAAAAAQKQQGPENAALTLELGGLRGGKATILSKLRIGGRLSPFAGKEEVHLSIFRNGREIEKRVLGVQRSGDAGTYATHFRIERPGRYAVQAFHERSPDLTADASLRKKFKVRVPGMHRGKCGRAVRGFLRGMRKLGYVPGGGMCFKAKTGRAVLAYRKVNGLGRSQHAGPAIAKRVFAGKGAFDVRHGGAGEHVEVSIGKQVLVIAKGDRPVETYHVSTGKPSTPTVRGHFQFIRREPGTNSHGMVHSTYFHGGYAVHGYPSVPVNYPASHGCIRVPIPDALHIYNTIFLGEDVFVY